MTRDLYEVRRLSAPCTKPSNIVDHRLPEKKTYVSKFYRFFYNFNEWNSDSLALKMKAKNLDDLDDTDVLMSQIEMQIHAVKDASNLSRYGVQQ